MGQSSFLVVVGLILVTVAAGRARCIPPPWILDFGTRPLPWRLQRPSLAAFVVFILLIR